MWVIANGAPKTGSTWPVQLLKATKRFETIPKDLQNPNWKNSSVRDDLIEVSRDTLSSSSSWFLSKQHWQNRNGQLLEVPGIKLLNTIRDLRDTFVSRYYHDVRIAGIKDPIPKYVRRKAKDFVTRFCMYQEYWISAANNAPNSYFIASYERLSNDYENATRELFDFCDLKLTDEEFETAVEFGSFKNRKSGPGRFFRKGKVHAFSDDLSEEDAELLLELSRDIGLREIKKQIASFNPNLAPFLEVTDVGL
jgi:sulfotransferase family protein